MANVLCLHMDVDPIVDSGPNQVVVTNNGVTIQSADCKFNDCGDFEAGEGDSLFLPNSALWDWGTSQWTVHCWLYLESRSEYDGIWSSIPTGALENGINCSISDGGGIRILVPPSGYVIDSDTLIPIGSLTHLAVVRDATHIRVYINGTVDPTGQWAHSGQAIVTPTTGFAIGQFYRNTGGFYYDGRMDEFIIDDTALWTTDFTPPDAPLSFEYALDRYLTPSGSVEEVAAALETQLETIDDSKTIHHIKVIQDSRDRDLVKGVLITDT